MATALQIVQEVGRRLNLDETVTANRTKLNAWADLSQQQIASRHSWSFLEEREIITTVVDKTAGTVAVTNASATVTGTSTSFASTDVRSYINFTGDSSDWYEVTAQASATSLTITPAFQGTTTTSTNYTLRNVFYNLSNNVDRIIDVRQFRTPSKMTNIGVRIFDMLRPNMTSTGSPRFFYVFRLDPADSASTTKNWQIVFYPVPDFSGVIEVRFLKILPDFASTDGNISQIPVKMHDLIIDYSEYLGKLHLGDPDASAARQRFELGIQLAIDQDGVSKDWHPVLQSVDRISRTRFLQFPEQFEQPA